MKSFEIRHMNRFLSTIIGLLLLAPAFNGVLRAQGAKNVLLIVNDASNSSRRIAASYRLKHNLPEENVCHLWTSCSRQISRSRFRQEILDPVGRHLRRHQLQDRVLYIVTTMGLPLLVEGDQGPIGDMAAVDSELTMLYRYLLFGRFQTYGRIENPYFALRDLDRSFLPFQHRDFDIYLVSRITGSSVREALNLIEDGTGSAGAGKGSLFYFDPSCSTNARLAEWTRLAESRLKERGLTVISGQRQETAPGIPLLGYVVARPAASETNRPRWAPGALSLELYANSALDRGQRTGPVQSGVENGSDRERPEPSGRVVYTGDPTLDGYIRPQIFFPAITEGYNLVESCFRATRYLSWRQVLIGDPLAHLSEFRSTDKRRASLVAAVPRDAETGLPVYFEKRRSDYLSRKYALAPEVVGLFLKAESLGAASQPEAALKLVQSCLVQVPQMMEARQLEADLYLKTQRYPQAFQSFEHLLKLGKSDERIYRVLAGLAYFHLKDAEKAAPYLRYLYILNGPADAKIAKIWAQTLLILKRNEEAAGVLSRVLREEKPPPAFALGFMARLFFEKGDLETAREFARRALQRERPNKGSKQEATAEKERMVPASAPREAASDAACDGSERSKRSFVNAASEDWSADFGSVDEKEGSDSASVSTSFPSPASDTFLRGLLEDRPLERNNSGEGLQKPAAAADKSLPDSDNGAEQRLASQSLAPRVISRVAAQYPESARRAGMQGPVVLDLYIDEMGQLMSLKVVHGRPELAKAAEEAVKRWRFAPRLVRGKAEPGHLIVTLNFRIKKR